MDCPGISPLEMILSVSEPLIMSGNILVVINGMPLGASFGYRAVVLLKTLQCTDSPRQNYQSHNVHCAEAGFDVCEEAGVEGAV